MKTRSLPFLCTLLMTLIPLTGQATFVPESDIFYGSLSKGAPQISEAEFNARITEIAAVYTPIVEQLGGRLKLA
jgi:hypothetical protein